MSGVPTRWSRRSIWYEVLVLEYETPRGGKPLGVEVETTASAPSGTFGRLTGWLAR
jgi:hypothetical protein